MNNQTGLVHENHSKNRIMLDMPKHTFLMGYAVDNGVPVVGHLQERNKFLFATENELFILNAMNNTVVKNKDVGYVIMSNRWEYWDEQGFKDVYIYEPSQLEYVLDIMEDKVTKSDNQDVILVIDNISNIDNNLIRRMILLDMFALFWWSDLGKTTIINQNNPDLVFKYKTIYQNPTNTSVYAVRKTSQWLNFTLS